MKKIILVLLVLLTSFLYSDSKKFGFKDFEIYKVKKNLHSFSIEDIDNDKMKDIIFVDNNDTSISILYQQNAKQIRLARKEFIKNKEELDINKFSFNLKYKNLAFITEKTISSMTVSDIGGNSLKDLIYLTSRGELFIKYQKTKRNFTDGQYFKIIDYLDSEYALVAKDVNNDNKNDLVLLGKKYLYIFYQNKAKKLDMPVKYSYSSKNPLGIEINDLNGDGLNDIIFVTSGGINQLRVKFQLKDKTIGPDNLIEYPNFHFLTTKNLIKSNKKFQFLSSRSSAHIIFIDEVTKVKKKKNIKPSIYSLNSEAESMSKSILLADFDYDGKKDLVVSDPLLPSIMFFKGSISGFKNYKEYPLIKDISKLIKHKIGSKNKIIAFSQKENALIVYNLKKKAPTFIAYENKVKGITKYKNSLYWVVDKEGNSYLEKINITNDLKVNVLFSRKINNSPDSFDDFFIDRINKDKNEDIVFTVAYEGAKVFISKGYNLDLMDIKVKNIKSFLASINKEQIKLMDFNKNGLSNIVVSNKGMIRALEFDKDKGLKIISQINGVTINSNLTTPVLSNIFGEKHDFVFYDKSNSKLYLMNKKTLEIKKEINIKGFEVNEIFSLNADNDKSNEFILLGRKSIAVYDDKNIGFKLKNLISYRIPKEKSISTMLEVGNFNGKKLVSIDGADHSVNFFKIKNNNLKPVMKFKVFDAISYKGRGNRNGEEPSAIYISDMNNDKKDDIILYIHDKLLIYYQE